MLRFLIWPAVAGACAGASFAMAEAADCASISQDLDRLACYDQESGRTPTPSTAMAGAWRVDTSVSKFDDRTDVFLTVASEEIPHCSWNREGEPVFLTIRCLENTTALVVDTPCHVTDNRNYGEVDMRADDEPTSTVRMRASTNNQALGLWTGGRAIPVVKRLIGKSTLLVRFTPYSHSAETLTFNISGLDTAIPRLRESCGW
ncbi:type VI secretion system-associated protein TagO [Albimonas sp. CAU 1670]|uniref:type VI secretion system-associated protein TagO n=1 Tax=Albimonas sp. CAU 1670 TaxID=3032599 RepID=UPI0023DB8323|nr:type VI secretion system-associated protein TagO [Albimonas sp. CAU 1670]MDF2234845.1 type VI secretion system-associated protein TagO [Albimonas sp. CAU 1670]